MVHENTGDNTMMKENGFGGFCMGVLPDPHQQSTPRHFHAVSPMVLPYHIGESSLGLKTLVKTSYINVIRARPAPLPSELSLHQQHAKWGPAEPQRDFIWPAVVGC